MARDYLRPGVCKWKASESGVRINPTPADVLTVLAEAQQHHRRRLVSIHQAEEVWRKVVDEGAAGAYAGQWFCPPGFAKNDYGFSGTVLQMVRITDLLIGLCVRHIEIPPGESSSPPVFPYLPEQRRRFPRDWVASVQSVFGDFLSDTELADIRRRAYEDSETGLAAELAMDAAQAAEEAALAEQKRREKEEYEQRWRALEPERKAREEALDARRRQVTNARQREKYWVRKLMRGGKFEPTTELAEACRTIADTLQDEGKQHVRWAELKKRWPSVASRYQRDFVWYYWSDPLSVAQLRNIDPDQRFVLAFGVWAGPQRIFPAKQLLIHVRAPDLFQEFQDRGGLHGVVADTAAEVGRHFPIADSIGWLRVHVDDGNRLCFVDEVQSDLLEALLQRKGNDVVKQFVDAAAQWHLGGFASIYRWARSIGYRAAIHSRESAAAKPGMTQSDRKWSTYYAPIIKRFGLREEEVKGYPARIWAGEAPGLDVVAPAGQSSPQTGTNAVGADEMR